ncbi:MAG: flagellum-specific ATP synthase FliI [Sphingomonadaceae bacterium]
MSAAAGLVARAAGLAARVAAGPLPLLAHGRLVRGDAVLADVEGLSAPVGALLAIETPAGDLPAEVAAVAGERLRLLRLAPGPLRAGDRVRRLSDDGTIGVGPGLLGRACDSLGAPLDGGPRPAAEARWPLAGRPVPPLARAEIDRALPTGVRAIDALFTLGLGQRLGLIAGTGVGKSVLLQQLLRGIAADAVVLALIGERGREIAGFLEALPAGLRARTHVVAEPADRAPALRIRAAKRALAAAEWLRSTGAHVLLLMDSLSRVALAARELGLALGEPVGLRGYPASALALIPALVERAGRDSASGGAITALFTLLAEGDDSLGDPVVDAARGALDGHILLDREIAARGAFPAIDVARSISRTMDRVVDSAHRAAASACRRDWALAEGARDLLAMGAHVPGQDEALDRALARRGALAALIEQPAEARAGFEATRALLIGTWGEAA